MARYENRVGTIQARTIAYAVKHWSESLADRYEIEQAAFDTLDALHKMFPDNFTDEDIQNGSVKAFTLSMFARESIKRGELSVLEYVGMIAEIKRENRTSLRDFGAFGDLYEILVRCAFLKNLHFVHGSAIAVKAINVSDIVSKKYGIIEVGHNGKTLSFASLFDYMDGEYTAMVYGVFTDKEKEKVFELCDEQEVEKAIDFIAKRSVYWRDKYEFQKDMDGLTRGKGIALKGENVQVVYNYGKHKAFRDAIASGKFTCIYDMIHK